LGAPGWLSWLSVCSGHDLGVLGWSPTSGFLLSRESASPSPSVPPPACSHSLSQVNKQIILKKKKKKEGKLMGIQFK